MRPSLSFALIAILPFAWASEFCGLAPPQTNVQFSSGTSSNVSEDVLATGWYPGWLGSNFPPSNVSWSKFTSMKFAFAVTTPDPSTISLDSVSQQTLPVFVSTARQNNVSPIISIGGWTGSQYFSTAVATSANRTAFVKAVVALASQYQVDGIDFDWEYPNKQGIGCNTISPNDSANFLLFLQQLQTANSSLVLSAAVGITPFVGSDGTPMTNVAPFAKVLDHITIMAYDIWGSWSATVGPNAPLADACATTQAGSATSAVQAWTAAAFPAGQIALGVAAYGHSFLVTSSAALDSSGALVANPPFDKTQQPRGDAWDTGNGTTVDACGNPENVSGVFNFWGLVAGGFLTTNGTAAPGIDYRYDNCSQTPYVYNPTSQVMVSYDDATSFAAKGQFINDMGLKGFAVWNAAGDYQNILMNSISDAIGIVEECS